MSGKHIKRYILMTIPLILMVLIVNIHNNNKDKNINDTDYKVEVVDEDEEQRYILEEAVEEDNTNILSETYNNGYTEVFDVGEITNGILDIKYNGEMAGIVRVIGEKSTINHYIFDDKPKRIGLTEGNGDYTIELYKYNGGSYIIEDRIDFKLKDSTKEMFTTSTINVDYAEYIDLIRDIINRNKDNSYENTLDNIFEYISEFDYDYDIANKIYNREITVYEDNIGDTIEYKKGICSDFARVMAASSRVMGIPAKLVYGEYGGRDQFHAWAEVNIGDEWIIYDPTKNIKTTKDDNSYREIEIY